MRYVVNCGRMVATMKFDVIPERFVERLNQFEARQRRMTERITDFKAKCKAARDAFAKDDWDDLPDCPLGEDHACVPPECNARTMLAFIEGEGNDDEL